AQGRLAVSGQRQSVQHRDGGIVAELRVREGQEVRQGDVVMRLAAAEVLAQERALASQWIGLMTQRARLRAEQLGQAAFAEPAEFVRLVGIDREEANAAMQLQQAAFASSRS